MLVRGAHLSYIRVLVSGCKGSSQPTAMDRRNTENGRNQREHFYWLLPRTTWCFALKGLRTNTDMMTKVMDAKKSDRFCNLEKCSVHAGSEGTSSKIGTILQPGLNFGLKNRKLLCVSVAFCPHCNGTQREKSLGQKRRGGFNGVVV